MGRGYLSVSSDDDDGCGLEYAFSEGDGDNMDTLDPAEDQGNLLVDFV